MTDTPAEATDFKDGSLYKALVRFLPTFTKNPFSPEPELNVKTLQDATGKSHEAVYKWLRSSRLTPKNAQKIVTLANTDQNKAILAQFERVPPTLQDFHSFVF